MPSLTIAQREQIKAAQAEANRLGNLAHETPESKAAHAASEAFDVLCEQLGVEEPCAWCEGCSLPFFDGDDFGTDEHGVSSCREGGSCLIKP